MKTLKEKEKYNYLLGSNFHDIIRFREYAFKFNEWRSKHTGILVLKQKDSMTFKVMYAKRIRFSNLCISKQLYGMCLIPKPYIPYM